MGSWTLCSSTTLSLKFYYYKEKDQLTTQFQRRTVWFSLRPGCGGKKYELVKTGYRVRSHRHDTL